MRTDSKRWYRMTTRRRLRLDRKLRKCLIRLFSHTEKRRSHPRCLFILSSWFHYPEGQWGQEPSKQEASEGRDEMKEGAERTRGTWTWMSPSLENRLPGSGRFHSSHMPQGHTGSPHFKAHLLIFLHVQHFVIIEKLGQTGTLIFQSHNFYGGKNFWAFALYSGGLGSSFNSASELRWLLYSSGMWREFLLTAYTTAVWK